MLVRGVCQPPGIPDTHKGSLVRNSELKAIARALLFNKAVSCRQHDDKVLGNVADTKVTERGIEFETHVPLESADQLKLALDIIRGGVRQVSLEAIAGTRRGEVEYIMPYEITFCKEGYEGAGAAITEVVVDEKEVERRWRDLSHQTQSTSNMAETGSARTADGAAAIANIKNPLAQISTSSPSFQEFVAREAQKQGVAPEVALATLVSKMQALLEAKEAEEAATLAQEKLKRETEAKEIVAKREVTVQQFSRAVNDATPLADHLDGPEQAAYNQALASVSTSSPETTAPLMAVIRAASLAIQGASAKGTPGQVNAALEADRDRIRDEKIAEAQRERDAIKADRDATTSKLLAAQQELLEIARRPAMSFGSARDFIDRSSREVKRAREEPIVETVRAAAMPERVAAPAPLSLQDQLKAIAGVALAKPSVITSTYGEYKPLF